MRTGFWGILVALVGCAQSHGPASGFRADGLFVVCTKEDAGRYECDPQQDGDVPHDGTGDGDDDGDDDGVDDDGDGRIDEDTGDGEPPAPGDHDGCTDWAGGGPAIVLWPPNHKMHTIGVADCAALRSDCAPLADALGGGVITAVTSDEPLDVGAGGDGHTEEGDLEIVDASTVRLRSERQGGSNGRVYRIEIGSEVCEVHVPHDMGPYGGAVADDVAERITP